MKGLGLLLIAVLFFSFESEFVTLKRTEPYVAAPIAHRYFFVTYQTNGNDVGQMSFGAKGHPSEKEVVSEIRKTNSFSKEVDVVITNLHEFRNKSDFEEWIK